MFATSNFENRAIRRIGLGAAGAMLAAVAVWYAVGNGSDASAQTTQTAQTTTAAKTTPAAWRGIPAYHGQERHGGIPLENLRNAEDRLDSTPVENTHGDPVGAVRNVVVGRGGRPELVNVEFGGFLGFGSEVVPLKADTLGYDPRHKLVLTDMTVKELEVIAAKRDAGQDQTSY